MLIIGGRDRQRNAISASDIVQTRCILYRRLGIMGRRDTTVFVDDTIGGGAVVRFVRRTLRQNEHPPDSLRKLLVFAGRDIPFIAASGSICKESAATFNAIKRACPGQHRI